MEFSKAEENYLKTIYHLTEDGQPVPTNAIAEHLETKPASVSNMLKRLSEKEALNYTKYKGVGLTPKGQKTALWIVRKHRLWEVFLLEKLRFQWDEVHEVAEQLEHINSRHMIERLDEFLGFPKFDPHGDPIPDSQGNLEPTLSICLSEAKARDVLKIVAVKDTSKAFLQYLDKVQLGIGSLLTVKDRLDFDDSLEVSLDNGHQLLMSRKVTDNIFVAKS
jgi:DtxR family transcriptional regulator, Mn-dependent transcriptional regulator